ncbi:MAG: hypothetical protein SF028_06430 [Candidatus Sumerlaeia bacterium]|nr:hypothetical protein [Candidatus Sumerlaeia bacterium]
MDFDKKPNDQRPDVKSTNIPGKRTDKDNRAGQMDPKKKGNKR